MGQLTMKLYLHNMRERYQGASRSEKGLILDEFCATSKQHRKSAIRVLNLKPKPRRYPASRGRHKIYKPEDVIKPLKDIWLACDQICGQRLKRAIPLWLPFYENHFDALPHATMEQLKIMSSATIDRLLKPHRALSRRGISGTKPGSLLKTQIPIATAQWDNDVPGFVEADTVAHCGESLSGDFVWSLTLVDIATTWTENRATWNKGSAGVLAAIQSIEEQLPFAIKGFDSDNGSEFLNHHLLHYFTDKKVQFTRSRPYKKNDNAHVEQKNWTHVRQLLGYERFDNPKLVPLLNNLYSKDISLLRNHFLPTVKLLKKKRVGAKIIKKHSSPTTPYERVLVSPHINDEVKLELEKVHNKLDPFMLEKRIQKQLQKIYALVDINNRQKRHAL